MTISNKNESEIPTSVLSVMNEKKPIYADFNGSAPLSKPVREYLVKRIEEGPFANPNAIHKLGKKVHMGMENARLVCAKSLGAKYNQVIFNSGATEGINAIFHNCLSDAKERKKPIFIMSGIEHAAIPNTGKYYEKKGLTCKILPTLENGIVDIEILEEWLKEFGNEVSLLTIMAANNETGIIQPYNEISKLANEYNVPYFSDTTQFIGKHVFNFEESGMDFAVTSGHKIGALTGAGILLAKDPESFKPFIIGGGQEKGLRGGTQNYLGYESMAVALDDFTKNQIPKLEEIRNKRDEFEEKIKNDFPKVVVVGKESPRLASTTYISYPGIHGQAVQIELESQNIFVTTSSACHDNSPVTSRPLKAMNIADEVGRGVVRISLSTCSPDDGYDLVYKALKKAYEKLTKIKNF